MPFTRRTKIHAALGIVGAVVIGEHVVSRMGCKYSILGIVRTAGIRDGAVAGIINVNSTLIVRAGAVADNVTIVG